MAQGPDPPKSPNKKPPDTKPTTLTIHPTPFKPSYLSIPPSPFSPRAPITPSAPSINQRALNRAQTTTASSNPPPPSPLKWLWQCHKCGRTYQLGVTRRCLDDGHFFCAGTTTIKSWRKPVRARRVRQHRACASEFDYQGWKSWGRWRRGGERSEPPPSPSNDTTMPDATGNSGSAHSVESSDAERDGGSGTGSERLATDCCNRCDYPSECRWGTRFGVHTPAKLDVVMPLCPPPPPPPPPAEPSLEMQIERGKKTGGKGDFWRALLASASRRRGLESPRPLALGAVAEEVERAEGEDVEMETVSLGGPSSSSSPSIGPSSSALSLTAMAPVALLDIITTRSRKGTSKTAEGKTLQIGAAVGSSGDAAASG